MHHLIGFTCGSFHWILNHLVVSVKDRSVVLSGQDTSTVVNPATKSANAHWLYTLWSIIYQGTKYRREKLAVHNDFNHSCDKTLISDQASAGYSHSYSSFNDAQTMYVYVAQYGGSQALAYQRRANIIIRTRVKN